MHVVYGLRLSTRSSVHAFDAGTNVCKDEQFNPYLLKSQQLSNARPTTQNFHPNQAL
jgi:hypothetical protein